MINPSLSRYKISTEPLDPLTLNLGIINDITLSENSSIPLHFKEFYELNPKDVPEELKDIYDTQKNTVKKLEEIKSKHKVDEFTKQINLNFGYFTVEIPADETVVEDEFPDLKKSSINNKSFPLFTIPIEINSINNRYSLNFLELNCIPNIGFLSSILSEDSFYQFITSINSMEINGELTLPLKPETTTKIWEELKGRLKLSDVQFDENSFQLTKFVVSLSSKSNYFLAQDLKKLVEMNDEELLDTSLSGWVSDNELNIEEPVDENKTELFFPFDYNKYQSNTLSIINNKVSIVQGPPGTGKSQTIANLLCHLAAQNKTVLFLSQKAQALKVVKDTLKSLDIEYLFGYIPNRYSKVYDLQEEKDGAAYALSGIQEYLADIHSHQAVATNSDIETIQSLSKLFNNSIEVQRYFYTLYKEYNELIYYEIKVFSRDAFVENCNKDSYASLKKIDKEIKNLKQKCELYASENKAAEQYEKEFQALLSADLTYSLDLERIITEYEKIGYDRSSKIGRFLTNSYLKISLRDILKNLPREIFDKYEEIVKADFSRKAALIKLTEIKEFFVYHESLELTKKLSTEYDNLLLKLGLTPACITLFDEIIEKHGSDIAFENVIKRISLQNEIEQLTLIDPNKINENLHKTKNDKKETIKTYIKNRIKQHIIEATYTATTKGILARISRALQKSKKAYRTFDTLKNDPSNFQTIKQVIPIWIMDLEDASRLIPLEKNFFDYIILDEASQCNLAYAIPAMYRSKHVIFFGDSEQMRDDSIKFKTNQSLQQLADKFSIPDHLQIKSKSDAVKSVLDIGTLRGFKSVSLLYHYRSPKEIIGFSNDYFYAPKRKKMHIINANYLTYKDTNKVMLNHIVSTDRKQDVSDKTNKAEACYIAELIKQLKQDEKTKNKSIGVLTFFNEQAYLLKQEIAYEDVKISVIEGIQGDEKDIIIYSFVISDVSQKNKYVALSSESGEINKELNAGRVNVAFSRARLQIHCVTSLPVDEWPDGVWVKKYLEYVDKYGKVDFYNNQLNNFDSQFEQDFYTYIRSSFDTEFIIQNQVGSCGFKIDFVITNEKTHKKLAIECDGPTHFENEETDVYVENDIERQTILESAGWEFYRVTYSDWTLESFDKKNIVEFIKEFFTR